MNIDQSFEAFKRDDLKVVCSLKLDNEETFKKKRIIIKIIKFDKNNQYGFAMTKPMPTGCIMENNSPTWLEFNLLLEKVSLEDSAIFFLSILSLMKRTQLENNTCTKKFFHR